MAAAPALKIYNSDGEYEGATKRADAAIAIIAGIGSAGWTIRFGHGRKDIVWTEGKEPIAASESFDEACTLIHSRLQPGPHGGTVVVNPNNR